MPCASLGKRALDGLVDIRTANRIERNRQIPGIHHREIFDMLYLLVSVHYRHACFNPSRDSVRVIEASCFALIDGSSSGESGAPDFGCLSSSLASRIGL